MPGGKNVSVAGRPPLSLLSILPPLSTPKLFWFEIRKEFALLLLIWY